jgi:hypothetical protein
VHTLHLLPPVASVPSSWSRLTELVDARYLQLEERQRQAARQTVESLVRPDQPLEELLGLLARHLLEEQQQLAGGQTPQQALLQHVRELERACAMQRLLQCSVLPPERQCRDEMVAAAKDAGALQMRYRNGVYEAGRDFEFRRAKLHQSGRYRRCSQCAAQNNELR